MRPRALLLEGFPGCGKSFIARAIAIEWRVPQINFEISRLQSKWVGESESNTYQALRAIEASAPNILFMDEIEKAFAGVGGDSSGTTTRQFGTFLTWLNDHKEPIFLLRHPTIAPYYHQKYSVPGALMKLLLFYLPQLKNATKSFRNESKLVNSTQFLIHY